METERLRGQSVKVRWRMVRKNPCMPDHTEPLGFAQDFGYYSKNNRISLLHDKQIKGREDRMSSGEGTSSLDEKTWWFELGWRELEKYINI